MGQAKNRGSYGQRVEAAKARIEALRPDFIACNHCQSQVKEFESIDVRRIAGVQDCFCGVCEQCGRTTYALKGTKEALRNLVDAVQPGNSELPMLD